MEIGFIGLGNMGNPMARNLIRSGHHLVVHDLREQAAANLIELGAAWAPSPRAVAERCSRPESAHGRALSIATTVTPWYAGGSTTTRAPIVRRWSR